MKKKITTLLIMLFAMATLVACGSSDDNGVAINTKLYEGQEGKTFVAENSNLKLELNSTTTQFSVTNKATGKVWSSNPSEADMVKSKIAVGKQKYDLMSTLLVKYSNKTDTQVDIDNYSKSIKNKNYTIEQIANGIQVNYTIGEVSKDYLIPPAATESRIKQFTSKMSKFAAKRILGNNFIYYKYDQLEDSEKDAVLKQFPDLEKEPVYMFKSNQSESFCEDVEANFKEAGYTEADYLKDKAAYTLTADNSKPVFNISIQYVLDGDQLKVVVPMNKIQCRSTFPIIQLSVLPFMGAGSVADKGFVIVPEGTGGIINFNTNKKGQQYYTSNMYGWDYGINRTMVVDETKARFPMFGIAKNGTSMLCVAEEGSSYAVVASDIAANGSGYNYGRFSYALYHGEDMDIGSKSDTTVRMYQDALPNENIVQRYIFADTTDYSTMAATYRTYLMKKYPQLQKKTTSQVPLAVEMVGAVDNVEHFLGFPVTKPQALTTYSEAKSITEKLIAAGVTPTNIKYTGWFNGGVKHTTAAEISLISRLGSSSELQEFADYAKSKNLNLYLDGTFGFVLADDTFDGFVVNRDAAKFVSREIAELYNFWAITFVPAEDEKSYYLAKPKYAVECVQNFAEEIAEYGIKNISFDDFGSKLGSDYNVKDLCSREANLNLQKAEMEKLQKAGSKLMINEGNQYAVPYSDMITGLDITTKKINIVDRTIPFYTMALHGLVNYSGDAINLAEDSELNILRSVENGAGLYYTYINASTDVLQQGNYTKYYACNFADWKPDTVSLYKRFQTELGDTYNQFMVKHEQLASGVFLTEYENGKKVIVNYNYKEYNYNGTKVPARNFITQGGGK